MTKDLAILIDKNQKYLTTNQFLDAIDGNLKKKLNQKLLSLQPPLFCIISPGTDKIENNVSSSPVGPATFANNLSAKITSSDNTPFLTNAHALFEGFSTSAGVFNFSFAELL